MEGEFGGGAEIGRGLEAIGGIFLEHLAEKSGDGRWEVGEFMKRGRFGEVLDHDLGDRSREGSMASEHVPESDAEGVDIGAEIGVLIFELFWAGEVWGTDEAPDG
jgi:hypothetical protein